MFIIYSPAIAITTMLVFLTLLPDLKRQDAININQKSLKLYFLLDYDCLECDRKWRWRVSELLDRWPRERKSYERIDLSLVHVVVEDCHDKLVTVRHLSLPDLWFLIFPPSKHNHESFFFHKLSTCRFVVVNSRRGKC